jgi:CheY-like chemotaxis protein
MSLVLVVDDEQAIREFLDDILTGEGYQVSTASNGQEALTHLATAQPDLVLLDIMMPVLDGREVLRRMRADPTLSRVAVLVMSAAADPGPLAGGFDSFLPKPFDLDRLLSAIEELLRSSP